MRFRLLCILLFTTLTSMAQNTSDKSRSAQTAIDVGGKIADSFTYLPLKAKIFLLDKDSVLVDSCTSKIEERFAYYRMKAPRTKKEYIIKALYDGYYSLTKNITISPTKRTPYILLDDLLMKKKPVTREANLDEVVVTGTRVQMTYRGDTIVYDASAFILPEGSMLSSLVKQLPGADLKSDGTIYINGKKVDYLMLNGNDFFKGKNKLMLDNLPYFIVKDLKVYDRKVPEEERTIDKKLTEYVMDVTMKREYNHTTLANAEVGGGTQKRWLGRVFGMSTGERVNMFAFANANNINEDRVPGETGDWSPARSNKGELIDKQVAATIGYNSRDQKIRNKLEISSDWRRTNSQSKTLSEKYSTDGNIFKGQDSRSRSKDYIFNLANELKYRGKTVKATFNYDLYYKHENSHSSSSDSTWRASLTNRNLSRTLRKFDLWRNSIDAYTSIRLPWEDRLSIITNFIYETKKPNDTYSLVRTDYLEEGSTDRRNNYKDNNYHFYNYRLGVIYSRQLTPKWELSPRIMYRQNYERTNNVRYRLDRIESLQDELGVLPSTDALLDQALDMPNSYLYGLLSRQWVGCLILSKWAENSNFEISLPLEYNKQRMHYLHNQLDTLARRTFTTYTPRISWEKKGPVSQKFEYELTTYVPDYDNIMPYGNNSDPLNVRIYNPDLKSRIEHKASYRINVRKKKANLNWWIAADGKLIQRAWGVRTNYNTQMGAFTYKKDNVNGNWNANGKAGFTRTLDKKRLLQWDMSTQLSYVHSVDFDITYDNAHTKLSKVNTWNPQLKSKLNYHQGMFTATLIGEWGGRFVRSDRKDFENINAHDFQYGLVAQYTIPIIKLTVGTDLTMFSRRGYNSDLMNTDDLVWNAQLTRSFFRGNVVAKVKAFDLLHQLSNKTFAVNAQGRTETWQNSLPHYLLLSVAVKTSSKKKSGK